MRQPLVLSVLVLSIFAAFGLAGCGSSPAKSAGPPSDLSPGAGNAAELERSAEPVTSSFRATSRASDVGAYPARLTTGDYAGRPDVERFIAQMEDKGLDRRELVRVFSRVERDPWIIEYMDRQWRPASGPTGAWTRYRGRHITASMLHKGDAFWARHAQTLDRAARKYGVPPEYIVAIIGIETRWGGYMGEHRIIDALSTLAFDYPRRAEYFQDELEHYLLMADDQGFDPLQPVGSFAGAMGLGQFMPSSWHDYAIDFDGDGRRDLWDAEDAIGSVAHYFKAHGWQPGAAVVARASGGYGLPWSTDTGFKTDYSIAKIRQKGLRPAVALPDDRRVSLLRLDAAGGPEYWLGFENFYVITRYNRSTYYAMTVHQLAQTLRARRGLGEPTLRVTSQPRPDAPAG
ncbi:lytic murein transglycosylase B [Halochromatium glycolicum]|uniref:Lytic murein transglycosylase B n=1 Tax=Halochromatium glycolicum TaxID=85075 RepID=A0AAJ0U3Q4_9GAMM|nr:lytic murein transglycosylase B [Halochromatium glycolicum]